MKVVRNIGSETFTSFINIIDNYQLVNDDYDIVANNKEDVTSYKTLSAYLAYQRISDIVFRDSLKKHVIPIWDTLDSTTQKSLIYKRVYPSTINESDIIAIIGEDEWMTLSNTKSESEYIQEIKQVVDTYFYVDKNTKEFTTENTLQTYLQLNVANIPAGLYKIEFSVIGGNDNNRKQSEFDFFVDGQNVATPIVNATEVGGATQTTNIGLIKDLTEGSHLIEVKFRAINGNAFIGFASIRLGKES